MSQLSCLLFYLWLLGQEARKGREFCGFGRAFVGNWLAFCLISLPCSKKNPGLASEFSQRQAWSRAPVSQELEGLTAQLPASSSPILTRMWPLQIESDMSCVCLQEMQPLTKPKAGRKDDPRLRTRH